jgi:Zn-dependent protease with chaperone function
MKRFALITPLLLSQLFIASCTSQSTKQGSVGIERKQMLLLSESEMNQGADEAYQQVLSEAQEKQQLNTQLKQLERLQTIADRLIPQTVVYRQDAPDWDWQVNLIQSNQLNAWCMPGGKIVFYSGIIDKLQLTDDEIAAIMGHEMAHALRQHGRERASQMMVGQAGLTILSVATGAPSYAMDLSSMAMQVTIMLPNSRVHETEADRIGVELAARGGYDPYAAIKVWQKMAKQAKTSTPEMISTHPSHRSRIADLKQYAKRVEPLYLEAKKAYTVR